MKNEDRIKSMSSWEMAEFIYNVSNNAIKISVCTKECSKCDFSDSYCTSEIAEWLMQEADN